MVPNIQISPDKWRSLGKFLISREWLIALLTALFVIAVGTGLGFENNKIVPVNSISRYLGEPHNPLSFLSNWDGLSYLAIALHGYTKVRQTNFFPLYPLLIHLVNFVLRSPLNSALLISWTSFACAIYFYLKIVKLFFNIHDNAEALKATFLFILFPTGVFFLATYTESLFAALALGAIYFALQKRYILSGLFTLFATATHINGLFLLIFITLLLAEARLRVWQYLTAFLIGSLGIIGYMVFLWDKYHRPFDFISTQRQHGWFQHGFFSALASFSILNYAFVFVILLAIIYWWKRRKSFSIYSIFYLCVPLVGGQFGGFARYSLMVFPVPLMIYEFTRNKRLLYPAVLAVTAICWTYFLFQYAGGYIGG